MTEARLGVADWLASIRPGVSAEWLKAFAQAKVTSVEQLKALAPDKLEHLFYRLHLIKGATSQRERVIAAVSAVRSVPRGLDTAASRQARPSSAHELSGRASAPATPARSGGNRPRSAGAATSQASAPRAPASPDERPSPSSPLLGMSWTGVPPTPLRWRRDATGAWTPACNSAADSARHARLIGLCTMPGKPSRERLHSIRSRKELQALLQVPTADPIRVGRAARDAPWEIDPARPRTANIARTPEHRTAAATSVPPPLPDGFRQYLQARKVTVRRDDELAWEIVLPDEEPGVEARRHVWSRCMTPTRFKGVHVRNIEHEEEIKKETLRTQRLWYVGGKKEAEIMRRICTPIAAHARDKA